MKRKKEKKTKAAAPRHREPPRITAHSQTRAAKPSPLREQAITRRPTAKPDRAQNQPDNREGSLEPGALDIESIPRHCRAGCAALCCRCIRGFSIAHRHLSADR